MHHHKIITHTPGGFRFPLFSSQAVGCKIPAPRVLRRWAGFDSKGRPLDQVKLAQQMSSEEEEEEWEEDSSDRFTSSHSSLASDVALPKRKRRSATPRNQPSFNKRSEGIEKGPWR